eukprot:1160722-Pelagomonas_calceolata.AAC.3
MRKPRDATKVGSRMQTRANLGMQLRADQECRHGQICCMATAALRTCAICLNESKCKVCACRAAEAAVAAAAIWV